MQSSALLLVAFICHQLVVVSSKDKCSHADVRLVNIYGKRTNGPSGYVEVCQKKPDNNNDWVLLCDIEGVDYNDTNIGAMHATCKQLGYVAAYPSKSHSKSIQELQFLKDYAIQYVNCPVVYNYTTDGEQFLMRCDHPGKPVDPNNQTLCKGILHLVCDPTPITEDPYNGQVQLFTVVYQNMRDKEEKALKLYYKKDQNTDGFLFVCGKPKVFTPVFLGTVCRQLGFTNWSINYTEPKSPKPDNWYWQLEEFDCQCTCPSLPCIASCLDPNNITRVKKCSSGYEFIYISCEFVSADAGVFGAGSRALCQSKINFNGNCQYSETHVVTPSVVLSVVIGALIFLCITLSVKLYKLKRKKNAVGERQPLLVNATGQMVMFGNRGLMDHILDTYHM